MEIFNKFKKVNASQRQQTNQSVSKALTGLSPKTAQLLMDLRDRGTNKLDIDKNASIKAMELVSNLLAKFSLPSKPTLEYHGLIKNATANDGTMSDGVIRVGARLHTLTGHNAHIDIPVIVRNRSLLEPAVFFYNDAPYVMCGPALEELVRAGTLMKDLQPRQMFSPPISDKESDMEKPRTPIVNLPNMYSPGIRNPWTFRRYSQAGPVPPSPAVGVSDAPAINADKEGKAPPGWEKTVEKMKSDPNIDNPFALAWSMHEKGYKPGGKKEAQILTGSDVGLSTKELEEGMRQAQKEKEPRKRTNIDTPTEMPEIWSDDLPEQILDPAERDKEGTIPVGCKVRLEKDYEVRNRGGGTIVLPSGEEGVVLRNEKADGMCLLVSFNEMGLTSIVPYNMLKSI